MNCYEKVIKSPVFVLICCSAIALSFIFFSKFTVKNEIPLFQKEDKSCGYLTFKPLMRLGNRIFEYVGSYAVAKQYHRKLLLPNDLWHGYNKCLDLKTPTLKSIADIRSGLKYYRITIPYMEDVKQRMKPAIALCDKNSLIQLTGYFQRWSIFLPYYTNGELKKQLHFMPRIRKEAIRILRTVLLNYSELYAPIRVFQSIDFNDFVLVGIHARRGDVVKAPRRFPASRSYLHTAISMFRSWFRLQYGAHPNKHLIFLGLGDDYKWNRENFPNKSDVIILPQHEPTVDLCLLSMCNHTIMTVGTFGWWAGFLSGGITIYMKQPFANGTNFAKIFKPNEHFMPEWLGI